MPVGRFAVDIDDDIARLNAGARGRSAVDRADHFQQTVGFGHLQAETAELAGGLDLHVVILLLIHVAAMRIQPGEHAVDRVIDQLVRRRVDHVIGFDPVKISPNRLSC